MIIDRRKFLIGGSAVSLVGLPETIQAKPSPLVPRDDLAILLDNLNQWMTRYPPKISFSYTPEFHQMMTRLTTTTWQNMSVRHLIPIEASQIYSDATYPTWNMIRVHDVEMITRRNKWIARHDFSLAYDGCIACGNGRRWQHNNQRCDQEIQRIVNDYYDGIAMDAAFEFDYFLLRTISNGAQHYPTMLSAESSSFVKDIRDIAARMYPPARWIVMSRELMISHCSHLVIKKAQPDRERIMAYLDDLPIYVFPHESPTSVLIGHDGSQETAIMSGIHILMEPVGVMIDPNTFQPFMPFVRRDAVWLDKERMQKHFVRASAQAPWL